MSPAFSVAALAAAALCLAGGAAAMPLQQPPRAKDVMSAEGRIVPIPDSWRKSKGATTFTVRIENVSPPDAMVESHRKSWPAGMSHGVYAVYRRGSPLFEPGELAVEGSGLEALAEDGNVRPLQAYLFRHPDVLEGGIFYKPVGAAKDEELWPGKAYEFEVAANPGDKLSFATMLMQSNDAFYAPEGGAIELFDESRRPISGDVSSRIIVWDAGTEVNQEGGFGPDAGMFQSGQDTGPDERAPVQPINDGYYYPPGEAVLEVTISPH